MSDAVFKSITVGTTQVRLTKTTPNTHGVQFLADAANSGTIYIGKADVGSNRYPLAAGKEVFIPLENSTDLYVLGSTSGQIVHTIEV